MRHAVVLLSLFFWATSSQGREISLAEVNEVLEGLQKPKECEFSNEFSKLDAVFSEKRTSNQLKVSFSCGDKKLSAVFFDVQAKAEFRVRDGRELLEEITLTQGGEYFEYYQEYGVIFVLKIIHDGRGVFRSFDLHKKELTNFKYFSSPVFGTDSHKIVSRVAWSADRAR